jgi:hypothetical protein
MKKMNDDLLWSIKNELRSKFAELINQYGLDVKDEIKVLQMLLNDTASHLIGSVTITSDGQPYSYLKEPSTIYGNKTVSEILEEILVEQPESVEERIPNKTKVIEKKTGRELIIADAIKTDNSYGYGVYLYQFEGISSGFKLYRSEFKL